MIDLRNNVTLYQASKAKRKPNILVTSILFILVISIGQMIGSMVSGAVIAITSMENMQVHFSDLQSGAISIDEFTTMLIEANPRGIVFAMLLGTLVTILLSVFVARVIEKRPMRSIGFKGETFFRDYLIGFLLGALAIALVGGVALAIGAMRFENMSAATPWGWLVLFLLGFLIQGLSEEVALRGYYMVSLKNRASTAVAIGLSSLVFAALHLMNSGITAISFVNLVLFAVFAGIYFFKTDSIWGIAAFHSAWNFVQGNVLGILVSGIQIDATIFKLIPVEGQELFSGGAFGLEGGLIVTLLCVILIVIMLWLPQKPRPEIVGESNELVTETPPVE
ncbi:MAG: CPBP family intramembrane metalloprotease [Chloroflexi bacterium]|nr:CPBP family intramembrane metalloprotease [Chloroflexota bacterium]